MIDLISTPSSGVDEVLAAMLLAHATHGRFVDANHLKRKFPPQIELVDIQEVLTSEESAAHMTDNGHGGYSLTDAGIRFARQNRSRHTRIDVGVDS